MKISICRGYMKQLWATRGAFNAVEHEDRLDYFMITYMLMESKEKPSA
jgi:hypothetical protein